MANKDLREWMDEMSEADPELRKAVEKRLAEFRKLDEEAAEKKPAEPEPKQKH